MPDRPFAVPFMIDTILFDWVAENIVGAECVGRQTIHWSSKEQGFQEFEKYIHQTLSAAVDRR